jgi:hypothetical protein
VTSSNRGIDVHHVSLIEKRLPHKVTKEMTEKANAHGYELQYCERTRRYELYKRVMAPAISPWPSSLLNVNRITFFTAHTQSGVTVHSERASAQICVEELQKCLPNCKQNEEHEPSCIS